ncbi:glycosyltransferase involved in cell wall biosynthesis [Kibdelosporangium banguiense]|uniref:Glycosyltransferase involved in cell wall biosynthesis n=1 Tax=Kibdelosporangium banguiense TaxID=1365924 RepID=A0ABS4U205_9PSEU|nr:glycosyltransferase [Kibdelosporangium banguiense]MBP2330667.1 glycosyltransferase involved in cell wall biosynthesis [Kibdelosporangium banguiense]
MRIAMVSEHASPLAALGEVDAGGQNLHVAELSAALNRLGHDVTVYTRRDAADLPRKVITRQGYRVVHIDAGPPDKVAKDDLLPHMGDFATNLRTHLHARPADVVHSHFWMSGLTSLLATRDLDVPVVQTFHALGTVKRRYQGKADSSPPERLAIERMIGRQATRIAATCADEQDELIRMGIARSRISVVPCGVDIDSFQPARHRAKPGGQTRIVTVGRLVPRKGFQTTIDALALLPDTELVIAGGPVKGKLGDCPQAQTLLARARRLGVGDRVRLMGQVDRRKMPGLLRSADAVVCVPWYEPFGIVPLEAMACGVPVVAAAVGGLLDTVVDHSTGLHVPARNPVALADALTALLHNEVMNETYGIAGRDRVVARYSWDRIALETTRVYESCVAVPRSADLVREGS